MPTPAGSSKSNNVTRESILQHVVPPEIRGNIFRNLTSTEDIQNAGLTRVFSEEARQKLFRKLDLNEQLKKNKIDELIVFLQNPVKGVQPLGSYVRELNYEEPHIKIKEEHLIAILKACDQLTFLRIDTYAHFNINWSELVSTKTVLQHFFLGGSWSDQKYDFWSLFSTLTTTSPYIESIILGPQYFTDAKEHRNSKTGAISTRINGNALQVTGSPCRSLKTVLVADTVWTVPYLKYLTVKAPNLVRTTLRLRCEDRLTELTSTLEAALKVWSRTLMKLDLFFGEEVVADPMLKQRQLLPLAFPKMEKLESLRLVRVQINAASLKNLPSVKKLELQGTNDKDIADKLSNRSILPKLEDLRVSIDAFDYYKDAANKRKSHRLKVRDNFSGQRKRYQYTGQ